MPAWSSTLLAGVAPLRSVNGYGLFRVMTTERSEIVIEGSADGLTWTEYPFSWKPGALARRPGFVQPHMPRLDWQMWFAALDPRGEAHWLFALVDRLLENDPLALRLLDGNPFPGEPPDVIRLVMYRYRFTTPDEETSGDWWARELVGYPHRADLPPAVTAAASVSRDGRRTSPRRASVRCCPTADNSGSRPVDRILFEARRLLLGQELLVAPVLRALHGCDGAEVPDALQVGLSPGRAGAAGASVDWPAAGTGASARPAITAHTATNRR